MSALLVTVCWVRGRDRAYWALRRLLCICLVVFRVFLLFRSDALCANTSDGVQVAETLCQFVIWDFVLVFAVPKTRRRKNIHNSREWDEIDGLKIVIKCDKWVTEKIDCLQRLLGMTWWSIKRIQCVFRVYSVKNRPFSGNIQDVQFDCDFGVVHLNAGTAVSLWWVWRRSIRICVFCNRKTL